MRHTEGYLLTADSTATAMNTIHKILREACQTKDELKLKHVVATFSQAILDKSVEIMWKYQNIFDDTVPKLGALKIISCF